MNKYNFFQNTLYVYRTANHFNSRYKYKLILCIVLTLTIPIVASIIPAVAIYLITSGFSVKAFLLTMGLIILSYAFMQALEAYISNNITCENIFIRLKEGLNEATNKTMTISYSSIECNKGRLVLSKAMESLLTNWAGLELMLRTFPKSITSLIGLTAYSAFIGYINPWIIVLLLGMTAAGIALNAYARGYELKNKEEKAKVYSRLDYFQKEARKLENNKDIRIYNLEAWFVRTIKLLSKQYSGFIIKEKTRYYLPNFSNSLFTIARDLIAYTILVRQAASGHMDAATFVFLTGIIAGFSSWLNQLTDSIGMLRRASIGVTSLREYMDMTSTCNTGDSQPVLLSQGHGPSVEFKDVSFTYPDASEPSLLHFSLRIEPGEKIALVGLNGAGKTTIVKLLSGLYTPSEGDIIVDGVSIKELNTQEYYKKISTVFQDVRYFAFTIAENVACCRERDIDYERVRRCLEKAGLADKVRELPLQERTCITQVLDSQGTELSGGQLQKLMLARALYKNAPILILDEPTAALDPIAESDMYMKYNETTLGKTSLFISHRLASTQFCDRIIFMEAGEIKEIGSHKQLMELDGRYAEVFHIQSQYYKENEKEGINYETQLC